MFIGVFRAGLLGDPPIKVPPYEVTLQDGTVPIYVAARSLRGDRGAWASSFVHELERIEYSYIAKAPPSGWGSPLHT